MSQANLPSPLVSFVSHAPRETVEALIQAGIDRLDNEDGDADLEREPDDEPVGDCCEAGDDGCAPFFRQGCVFWGSDHEEDGV